MNSGLKITMPNGIESMNNQAKVEHELPDILLTIAERFINVPLDQSEHVIHQTLAQIGTFVEADRVYVFIYDFTNNTCSNTHEWCADGITPEIARLQNVSIIEIPQWLEAHRLGQPTHYPDVFHLSDDDPIKAILVRQGIKSMITIPMRLQQKLLGFVGFDSVQQCHHYDDHEKKLLAVFAQMLVNLNERIETMRELEATRQSAESAVHVKSQFLANMSHELRTPLNAIMGFSELLHHCSVPEQAKLYTRKINQSSSHLLSIINDILDLSKIEADKLELKPEPSRVSRLILELDDMMKLQAEQKGIRLTISVDQLLHQPVLIDAVRFHQIMINLVVNAIKFTHQGKVDVSVKLIKSTNESVRLGVHVSDTGVGIDAVNLARLFEAFEQLDTTITRQFAGSGLGLFISQGLLKKMNSSLLVRSTPGQGSCFYFYLELPWAVHRLAENKQKAKAQVHPLQGTVLVVEDDAINRLLLRKMVERLDLRVREAEHGKAALAAVMSAEPDLILMDIQMPEMDGLTATTVLRQRGYSQPIIALSAGVKPLLVKNNAEDQFNDYLMKPLRFDDLRSVLVRWLTNE